MLPPISLRRGRGKAAEALSEAWSLETTKKMAEKKSEKPTLEYQLLAAGVNLDVRTFQLLRIGIGLIAAVVFWIFIPGIPAIVLGAIAWYIPQMLVGDRAKSRGREIDKHLPLAVTRIVSGLQAGGSIEDTLNTTADSLDAEGPNPLSAELRLTAMEARAKSVQEALDNLALRSPSDALANKAYLLKGYTVSGGPKYADALTAAARNTMNIQAARNAVHAQAASVLTTSEYIVGAMVIVLLVMSFDSSFSSSLRNPVIQIFMGVIFAFMGLGFLVMRNTEREAV
jgi:Flp pilus assembly protein TadB